MGIQKFFLQPVKARPLGRAFRPHCGGRDRSVDALNKGFKSGQISNTGQIYKKFCMGLNHCASLFSLIFEVAAFKGFKFVWFFHCGEK